MTTSKDASEEISCPWARGILNAKHDVALQKLAKSLRGNSNGPVNELRRNACALTQLLANKVAGKHEPVAGALKRVRRKELKYARSSRGEK